VSDQTPEAAALVMALFKSGPPQFDETLADRAARILANLPEGFALVSVEDVARRLHERGMSSHSTCVGPGGWCEDEDCKGQPPTEHAAYLLGIGGER
jgi:hypothetical protein